MEPDLEKHFFFKTYFEAYQAWLVLPEELKEVIAPPRQTHGGWIFDKEPEAWQS